MDFLSLAKSKYGEALELITKLVSFETVLDEFKPESDAPFGIENKKALEYILEYASKDGFTVKNVDNYAGHIEYGSDNDETIGILAHLDVVPVKGQNWTSNPFKVYVKDDKIYGRGTTDDKGPLVAAYLAIKLLKEQGVKLNKNVRLICGCDEETGSRCLKHYFLQEKMPELGFSPDAEFPVIYGEKAMASLDVILKNDDNIILDIEAGDRYNIVPALAKMKLSINLDNEFNEFISKNNYNGYIKDGYYYIEGRSSHAMVPQNGLNAIFLLMDFLNEYHKTNVSEYFEKFLNYDYFGNKLGINVKHEDMGDLTENVAVIKMHDKDIKIGINYRIPVNNYSGTIVSKITESSDIVARVDLLSSSTMHFVDKNTTLVKTLMSAYREISGDTTNEPFTIGGGTYSKFIDNCVAFGPVFPGREDVCHIADEYINVDDLINSIAIYAKAIYDLGK